MKIPSRFLLTLSVMVGIAGGCSEPAGPTPREVDPPPIPVVPPGIPPPVGGGNTAPRVSTIPWDVWVPLPANSSVLDGYAYDAESDIEHYSWKKVSGPASYSIEHPDSLHTKVINLEEGRYQFELTVTDRGGLSSQATASIVVYDPRTAGVNELIFKNLRDPCWRCDLWFTDRLYYAIENFHDYVPAGTAIRVFLKVAGSTDWVEVVRAGGAFYVFRINGDRFELEVDALQLADPFAPVDVMISY